MKFRFLLFVLLAAAVPPTIAVVVSGTAALDAELVLQERLTVASNEVGNRLDAEAAQREVLILRLTQMSVVRDPIVAAGREGKPPTASAVAALRTAVNELFPHLVPDIVGLATPAGAHIVVTSGEPRSLAVTDLPTAKRALDGERVIEFADFDGSLVRFFSAPIGVGEGALILGQRTGDATAKRLSQMAQAHAITFVRDEVALASSRTLDERSEYVPAAKSPNSSLATGRLGTGVSALAPLDPFFPLLVPFERYRSMGKTVAGDVTVVATISATRSLSWVGPLQVFSFGSALGILLIGFIWGALIYGPVKRQARSLESHVARLHVEPKLTLGAKGFAKPFTQVAVELDRLSTAWSARLDAKDATPREPPPAPSEPPPPPPVKHVALPLESGPAADHEEADPSAFGFGDDASMTPASVQPAPPPLDPPAPAPAPAPPSAAPAPAPAPPPPPPPPAPATKVVERSATPSDKPIPLPSPDGLQKRDPFAAFGDTPEVDDDDRTREAVIPQELLDRSRELEAELLEPPADPDEEHFKEVYAEFVKTRKDNGEGAEGLTLDKFIARLKKNREMLVAKYNCRTVRFQVYVKAGKAAVKASPVK